MINRQEPSLPGINGLEPAVRRLTAGPALARNAVWNLAGLALPLVVGLCTIPLLVSGLGTARFGVLALAWAAVGYFSLFDLGLGRALTQLVARRIGTEQEADLPAIVRLALILMFCVGLFGAALVALLAPWFAGDLLDVPPLLRREIVLSFYVIAAAIPIVTTSNGFAGILEAYQRFDLINRVRIPLGVINFVGPLFAVQVWPGLVPAVVALVLARVISILALYVLSSVVLPELRKGPRVRFSEARHLVRYGGWMTVANIVGPVMDSLDRYFIGAILSVKAVAYYSTPFDLVVRLRLIASAVTSVLFPAFAAAAEYDRARAAELFVGTLCCVGLAIFPAGLVTVAFAPEAMRLWLGPEFAQHSSRILQVLAVGVFVNSLAQFPAVLIQGFGRPDFLARLYLVEAPVYLIGLWWLLGSVGVLGAAIAWTLRVVMDSTILFVFATRLMGLPGRVSLRIGALILAGALAMALAMAVPPLAGRALYAFAVLALFAVLAWTVILTRGARGIVVGLLRRATGLGV